jgi:hypothetical protein
LSLILVKRMNGFSTDSNGFSTDFDGRHFIQRGQ